VGIRVMEVLPNSAADDAGLRVNDVIVGLDKAIWRDGSASRFYTERIRGLKPKSRIRLKVLRDGEMMELRVTLGRRPLNADRPFLNDRAADLEAAERAAKEAYFRRWLAERKAPD
jgi:C-terminal processing protease CtpA/Prc